MSASLGYKTPTLRVAMTQAKSCGSQWFSQDEKEFRTTVSFKGLTYSLHVLHIMC